MQGADVRQLQLDLTKVGFSVPAVGVFGPMTKASVKHFERAYGMKQNGIVDATFLNELGYVLAAPDGSGGASAALTSRRKAATPTPTPTPTPAAAPAPVVHDGGSRHLGERVLRRGMRGHDVRVLQGYLTLAGYTTPVTGLYGPMTQHAVAAFETDNNLPATGVVSYAVATALRAVVATFESAGGPVTPATLNPDGTATAPSDAPPAVKAVIAAANEIAFKPYIYGGGHGKWRDKGYDCSGSTSFALHGAGLISASEDSSQFESYGSAGPGQWITLYANGGHVYMDIAGLWFDTAAQSHQNGNDRWSATRASPASGFVVRHPAGL
jgi:peptidoglycan hydrolase-like protein with peptidoglycan-binding domain